MKRSRLNGGCCCSSVDSHSSAPDSGVRTSEVPNTMGEKISNTWGEKISNTLGEEIRCLMPGLPNEIALLCLAKVPLSYRQAMRAVCTSWRHVFNDNVFWNARQSEALILIRAPTPYGRNEWHCLHPSTREWIRLPAMPKDDKVKGSSASAVMDGKLFVVGGYFRALDDGRQVVSSAVSYFDMKCYQWRRAVSLNVARAHCAAGVIGNRLYVCGGITHGGSTSTAEVYDPISRIWTLIASMRSSRPWQVKCPMVVDEKLYVTFRENSLSSFSVKGIIYDPRTDEWSDMSRALSTCMAGTIVILNGKIHVKRFSELGSGTRSISFKIYNPKKDIWELFHHLLIQEDARGEWEYGQELVIFEGKLCLLCRYLQSDRVQYEIRDLDYTLVASSKSLSLDPSEDGQDSSLLYEENPEVVEYRIMTL